MKLTPKEQEFCVKYGTHDEAGNVHCTECPLNLDGTPEIVDRYGDRSLMCYSTIDGREARPLKLRRYY